MARYIHNIPILRSLQGKIRKKRADLFIRLMKPQASWKIIDVGGHLSDMGTAGHGVIQGYAFEFGSIYTAFSFRGQGDCCRW
jgi:hypothetical protein